MSVQPILRPSQLLEMWWSTAESDQAALGQLVDATDDRLFVTLDRTGLAVEQPAVDQLVSLYVATEHGLYGIPGRVTDRPAGAPLVVAIEGEARRIQGRRYARVQVSLPPVKAYLRDADDHPISAFTVALADIGGGGVRFECSERLEINSRVGLELALPEFEPFAAILTVINGPDESALDVPGGEPARYSVRGYFSAIDEPDRQRIIDFVFRRRASEHRRLATEGTLSEGEA
jgi:PilZ domain-containing protein